MNGIAGQTLQLRDIHAPFAPGFWPPAPGWWLSGALVLIFFAWAGWRLHRRYRLRNRRRLVLAALDSLGLECDAGQAPCFLAEVSVLLRRVALMRFPRERVAALTGVNWLLFLDETGGNGRFRNGPGRALAEGPYCHRADVDCEGVLSLARDWIKKNTGD